jgi:hypothetical protein
VHRLSCRRISSSRFLVIAIFSRLDQPPRNHWPARDLVFWLGPIGIIGGVIFSAYLTVGAKRDDLGTYLAVAVFLLIPVWLIAILVMQRSRIRAGQISRKGIVLDGLNPAFVTALEEQRRKASGE